ncbi:ankyrin repeat domain-containing protein [Wolbachia endosymbiont of Pentidionis agamae]|uniref:ankyrin repeat domain-containing protein n=1 Tax=Wolbachia endosymbiont of Pentidionis agamae TaxID=3110435 RepID=UPI002FCEA4C3
MCCAVASLPITKLLLENGADPWSKNHFGATPLYIAIEGGYYDTALVLINAVEEERRKEYMNVYNNSGYTPLHIIALSSKISKNQEKLIELLIKSGVNLTLKPIDQSKDPFFNTKSVMEFAEECGNTEFVRCVKSLQLIEAAKRNDLEEMKQLLQQGADAQFQNINRETALHHVINPDVVSTLINSVSKKERKSTSMHKIEMGIPCYII